MKRRGRKLQALKLSQSGQTFTEFLLLFLLGFLITGAIVGRGKNGGGVPVVLQRAAPVLGEKVQENMETGRDWNVKWSRAPKK